MGKKPADIEREIAELRDSIAVKLDRVQGRVRDDVKDFSSTAWDDIAERTRIGEHVEKRPMAAVAAALGVGVLLGMVSEGFSMGGGRGEQRDAEWERRNGASGGGMVNTVAGTASGIIGGKLGDELRDLLRQVLGEVPDEERERERAGARERPGAWRERRGGNGYAGSTRSREYERGN